MPKVRAVDEMNSTELRAELVSLLAEGFMRYMGSEQFTIGITQCLAKTRTLATNMAHQTHRLEAAGQR